MALKISSESVKNIASEVESLPTEATGYFNRNTGEFYVMFDEFDLDSDDLEDPEIAEGIPEWQKEDVAKRQAVLNDDAWIPLPNAFDVNEWELMKEFAEQVNVPKVGDDLLASIHGSGAFQRFKKALDHHDQREEWYAFKAACVEELVKEWLRSQDIEFADEA